MTFIDTNVFIRYIAGDDDSKAQTCYKLFQKVKHGKIEVTTSESVITEVVYILSSKRGYYQLPPHEIRDKLIPILSLKEFIIPKKRFLLDALDIYAEIQGLDITDALSIIHTTEQNLEGIFSYDSDFDKFSQIKRHIP